MESQIISSHFSGTSDSSDFTISLNKPISITKETSTVYIEDIMVKHTWYNINEHNKTIAIREDGIDLVIALVEGYYPTKTILAAHMQTQFNATTAGVMTITYDTVTDRYTFDNATLIWSFRFSVNSDPAAMLGYVNQTTDTSTSPTHVSVFTPLLFYSLIFMKFFFNESNVNALFVDNQTMSFSVPIVAGFGEMIFFKPDTRVMIQKLNTSDTISSIRIVLYDENLKLLNNHGGFVMVSFKFSGSKYSPEPPQIA